MSNRIFFGVTAACGLLLMIVGALMHAHDALLMVFFGIGALGFGIGGDVALDRAEREAARNAAAIRDAMRLAWEEEDANAHADHDVIYSPYYRD